MDGLKSSPVACFLEHILCTRKEGLEMLGRLVSSRGSVGVKRDRGRAVASCLSALSLCCPWLYSSVLIVGTELSCAV